MNRRLRFAMVIVAACCGCESRPNAPASSSHDSKLAASPSEFAASPASSTPRGENSQRPVNSGILPPEDSSHYVSFPAVGVKLARPSGFDDADKFHGFQQPSSQSSILVAMIPEVFSATKNGFTADKLKTAGMTLLSEEHVLIGGKTGVLLAVSQNANGTEFAKWILIFGHEKETLLVTAGYPKSAGANLSNSLKAAVLSAKLADKAPTTFVPDVGFTIVPSKKLKPATGAGSLGKILMYSKDGIIPAKSPDDPMFVAAPSVSKVPIDDGRQFAVRRLFQTAGTKISSVTSNTAITIDALDGFEIVAVAENTKTRAPLQVYQVILYDEGAYILMQGLMRASDADEYLPEFQAMARSLTR